MILCRPQSCRVARSDFNDFAEEWVKEAAPGNPEVVDGYFPLPDGPGLGVTLDEDFVREHPRQEVTFDLYAEDWHLRGRGAVEEVRRA